MMARFAQGPIRAKAGGNAYDGLRGSHAGASPRGRVLDDRQPYARGPVNRKALRRVEQATPAGPGDGALAPDTSWQHVSYLPTALGDMATGFDPVTGLIFACKGNTSTSEIAEASTSNALYIIDPETGDVTSGAPAPEPGGNRLYTGCCVGGKFYLLSRNLLEYDPATDTWATKATCPAYMEQSPLCAFSGRLMVGPSRNSFGDADKQFYSYDPFADAWTRHADVATDGMTSNTRGAVLHPYDGRLYYRPTSASSHPEIREWDPSTNTWAVMPAPTGTPPGSQRGGWADGDAVYVYDAGAATVRRLKIGSWAWEDLGTPTVGQASVASLDGGGFAAGGRLWMIGGTEDAVLVGRIASLRL